MVHFVLLSFCRVNRSPVIFGKGNICHIGNLRFHRIIDKHHEEYDAAKKRKEKTELARKIINLVKQKGGRFLKQQDSGGSEGSGKIVPNRGWVIVGDDVAHEKVKHRFRQVRYLQNQHKAKKKKAMDAMVARQSASGDDDDDNRHKPSPLSVPAPSSASQHEGVSKKRNRLDTGEGGVCLAAGNIFGPCCK